MGQAIREDMVKEACQISQATECGLYTPKEQVSKYPIGQAG